MNQLKHNFISIFIIFLFLSNPIKTYSQYDSAYYTNSNYGLKYYNEGEYKKSIAAYSLIQDSLLRPIDLIVLLNMYSNLDDTTNLKKIVAKYMIGNNNCDRIYSSQSLSKYRHIIQNLCITQFDSIYRIEKFRLSSFISFIDSSIAKSNQVRKTNSLDSISIAKVDNEAFLFLKSFNLKQVAEGLRFIIQKDKSFYTDFYATLIHMNYYDSSSSKLVESWAKDLMSYGILEPKDFAYIIDRRICVKGDSRQRYGEHLWRFNASELEEINRNRRSIGLIPIK